MDGLEWLEKWYSKKCNGYWEHFNGVKVTTLENPGWSVRVDLQDTKYQDMRRQINIDKGRNDWIVCWINNSVFEGAGDPSKLKVIIDVFRRWIDGY